MHELTPALSASDTAADGSTFLDRVVRLVAVVALAYAALNLVQTVLYFGIYGSLWGYARGVMRPAERAVQLSRVGLFLLLLVGSIGMLNRKPWARPAVMTWALLHVLVVAASGVVYIVQFAGDLARAAATTQAAALNPPLWQIVLWQVFWSVEAAVFPMLVWLILRQAEVAKLFEKTASGGFEVLPMARPFEPET